MGISTRTLMANGEVSSCIMETVPDIYRAIDFSGLRFVTVIFVIAQVNGQFKICAIRDK